MNSIMASDIYTLYTNILISYFIKGNDIDGKSESKISNISLIEQIVDVKC